MKRSLKSELAQRINHAFTLLKKEMPPSQIVEQLVEKFGVSKVQAYRYLQQAKKNKEYMAIPEASEVFTVKLPPSLSRGIRDFASSKGITISKAVSKALEDFLDTRDHGQRKSESRPKTS